MSARGPAAAEAPSRPAGPSRLAARTGAARGDRALWGAMVVLAALGAAVAGYLTYVHYAELKPFCAVGQGCERVQSSEYAELAGIPVAVLGLGGYLAIVAALLALRGEAQRVSAAFLALVGFGFSAYLTYRELFTIDAVCAWCVASAVLMTALMILAIARLVRVR